MCNPLAIIGGVISMAASAMQAQAQAAYVNAQNKANNEAYEISRRARQAEIARQQAHEADASAYWDRTTDDMARDQHDASRDDASEQFMQTFDDMASQYATPEGIALSGQQYASDAVKEEVAGRTAKAAADARQRVQALAALGSYGTTDVNRNQTLGTTSDYLQTLNGIRRGSLGVSQQEQNISPAQVTKGNTMFADILSGVGGMVSSFGGGGSTVGSISPRATAAINAGAVGLY